jgi:glycosyltransferase involved in cell wall biosynthesis
MPSLSEGFPTLLPEGMLCRIPIVATDAGGIPELLCHQETGWLVPRGDVASLVSAIDAVLSETSPVDEMIERAEQAALKGYTWRANAEKTMAVYDEAMAGSMKTNRTRD